jgi:large subunit ribosomal protein L15
MSIDLSELSPPEGASEERTRVGRGEGSGHGKTSGRGQKGQKARSGGNIPPHFEGGQMPIYRRLPKFGFNHEPADDTEILNVGELAERFDDGDEITVEALHERGLVKKSADRIKILGDGEVDIELTVEANAFSASAEDKIVNAGGSVEVV